MDTAKKFKPKTILLWEKVVGHLEAHRIVKLFPSAKVRLIKNQRYSPPPEVSTGKALIQGKRILMIGQTSSFVGNFDGNLGDNIRCCPYHKLVPISNGCPYYCSYCYLGFVYRKYSPFIKININYDMMFRQIQKALESSQGKISFNMGEMLDSLALDHITNLTTSLVPFFSNFQNAYLMLLTKSNNIDNLLAVEPNQNIVVSWSINPESICKRYEVGTASMAERIEAAKKCQEHGYRIRFRIDPGIIYQNWKTGYAELIQKLLISTNPENITLGMLRLLPGHKQVIKQAYGDDMQNLCLSNFVKGASDKKSRFPIEQRIEFYSFIIDTIRSFDKNISISLCRESPEIWSVFKDRCIFKKCNCVNW
ncbi:MAG: hypothetical protein FVQ80_01285 [Planctomycetes bacterium]|nr:hypothetical protein [Planctomycetota bacterium]